MRSCSTCLLLTMYCSFLFINDRVWWMYMFVYTLYKLSMSVYGYVFVWKCKLCLPVFVRWTGVVLYICMNNCLHVWMATGKISCKLTGSPSLNKVFNWMFVKHHTRHQHLPVLWGNVLLQSHSTVIIQTACVSIVAWYYMGILIRYSKLITQTWFVKNVD